MSVIEEQNKILEKERNYVLKTLTDIMYESEKNMEITKLKNLVVEQIHLSGPLNVGTKLSRDKSKYYATVTRKAWKDKDDTYKWTGSFTHINYDIIIDFPFDQERKKAGGVFLDSNTEKEKGLPLFLLRQSEEMERTWFNLKELVDPKNIYEHEEIIF